MKKIMYAILLLCAVQLSAQTAQIQRLVFPSSGDSVSASIVLKDKVAPIAVWTDSLTTGTTFKLQVGFNNSTTTAPTVFYDITSLSDSTVYSINLRTNRVTPLSPNVFLAAVGTYTNQSSHVWLRGVLGADQTNGKIVFVRLAEF